MGKPFIAQNITVDESITFIFHNFPNATTEITYNNNKSIVLGPSGQGSLKIMNDGSDIKINAQNISPISGTVYLSATNSWYTVGSWSYNNAYSVHTISTIDLYNIYMQTGEVEYVFYTT